MIKFILLMSSAYIFMQSNLPLQLFDKISGIESTSAKEASTISKHEFKNDLGDLILDIEGLSYNKQIEIWKISSVKNDFLDYFPDFSLLRTFVNDRISGEPFKSKMIDRISIVEDDFISGKIDSYKAKEKLLF